MNNTISVNMHEELEENPIIIAVIAFVYTAFAVSFIFAHRKDNRERKRAHYVEVRDNLPDERYRYVVIVYTGNRKRAGPTSTVAIQIIGRKCSKVHLLQEFGDETLLKQGAVTTFVLTTKSSIGDVRQLRLWHHNEGHSPEWYVERIIIQNYQTKEAWLFVINCWLSDHLTGEAKLDITVPAASISELHNFRSRFVIKSGNYVKERHMWYSPFAMHPWSADCMTRVQRFCCCMLHVAMVMLTSLAFYGTQGSTVIDLGFYSFQWLNIAVGIQSTILCFPVPFLVALVFRNTRGRSKTVNYPMSKLSEGRSLQNSILKCGRSDNSPKKGRRILRTVHPSGRKTGSTKMELLVPRIQLSRKSVSNPPNYKSTVQIPSSGLNIVAPNGLQVRKHYVSEHFSAMEKEPGSAELKKLPWYCLFFGWALVIFGVAYSSVVTFFYGMTYGIHVSRQWVVSLLSGILFSIFVMEPLKAITLAFVAVMRCNKLDISDWIPPLKFPVSIRVSGKEKRSAKDLKQLRDNNRCYMPPNVEKVMKSSAKKREERVFRRRIKDLSVHMVYLGILVLNAVELQDNRMFHYKNTLSNMFQVNTKHWKNVKVYTDIYTWLKGPVVDTLYGGHKSYFTDGQLLVISPPILRQQKFAKAQSCIPTVTAVNTISSSCDSRYDIEETRTLEHIEVNSNEPYSSDDSPWTYRPSDPWILPFFGEHGSYHSGGYIARFTKYKMNATRMLDHLEQNNWIDRHSKLVMMETVVYNVALHFYCYVQLSFEISSNGKVHRGLRLMIMKPHYVITTYDYVTYFSLFALLAIVFYFAYNVVNLARESGFVYFAEFWHLLEISTLLSSVGIVVTYLSKANRTDLAMHAIATGKDSMALLYTAANLGDVFVYLLGYCIFFTMLRTVAVMEGHHHFRLSYATMQIIRYELLGHIVCLLVGFCAFFHSGLILFRDMLDFSSFVRAAQSIVAYAAGAYMSNVLSLHPVHGGIFCFIFFIVYIQLFVNFFAVILENAFRESKLLLRNIRKEDFVYLTRKQIRSLFVLEGRKRALDEMKAKAEKEKAAERVYAEVMKIKIERERKLLFISQSGNLSMDDKRNRHSSSTIRQRINNYK